ncbi:prefoldin subunit [Colletotrichum tofieldiae]|uniref:Prefoldin subunit n=2 Tax=Colletotrichum spaethianum species complex TaxID=2707349 RepID=A0A166W410_9PEZI|nr:prefoldin subunit [Colletotrichum tofieldiae]GJC87441.1 prefoldin subunit 6 [Colletotrichum liriopes]GKT63854.1 prefoldin subunit [Colletotrichum tofieldiae]GKT72145.1 prefoldin subunit [Colletotrichum tofieldiae]GKT90047.1 prefoldin subunit [Colletotrichum tofieldiae]
MAEIQAKLQKLSEEYTALQQELQNTVQSRQKLEAQKQENLGVKEASSRSAFSMTMRLMSPQEFDKLKDGEQIYKLVGPVLLKQDKIEAESTVKGRLDFITKEIERHEDLIKDVQGKLERKKGDIIQLQTSAQAAAGQAKQA